MCWKGSTSHWWILVNREYAKGVTVEVMCWKGVQQRRCWDWWILVNKEYAIGVRTDVLEGEYNHVDVGIGGYLRIESMQ
jgi:hypothetical protein